MEKDRHNTRHLASGLPNVNRHRKDQSGQAVEDTEWFRVVAWEKLAEIADQFLRDQFLRKGGQVYVEGRLHSRRYTDRAGVERTAVEVVAGDLVLLGGRGDEASPGAPARQQAPPSAGGIDPHDPPF